MIESAKKGVKFNDLHSFHDFGLILTSLDTGEPEPKTHYIEIPGRQNPLDITEAVSYTHLTLPTIA